MKPLFSIALITRNEEKTLPKLLQSLEEFKSQGGETCILDTGSTDKTVEIAREWGCKVTEVGEIYLSIINAEFAQEINQTFIVEDEAPILKEGDKYFDFASARNHAASLCSNNMVSFVDADEAFTKLDIKKINEAIEKGITQFEYNFVFSHDQFGNEAIKFIQSKFYDRRNIKWTGIVHEVLEGNGNRMMLQEDTFKLEHYQNLETSRHSYLIGLAVDCFLNPSKDRNSHYFARELFWAGRPKSAIKEFARHIEMNGWLSEKAQSMIFMGDCYGAINNPDKQVEWYGRAFYTDSSRREPLLKLAWFYRHNNNYQATASYVAAAMEIPWSPYYGNSMSQYTYEGHELMYWAKGWLGDVPSARTHLSKALEYQPLNPIYLRDTQFYFDYKYSGIEGWMTWPELNWLYETAKRMGSVAEIGSWKGRSTHALLSGCPGTVYAIDHFEGSEDEKDGTHGAQGVYEQFLANVGNFTNLAVKKMSGEEGVKDFEDKSLDMVFIDAGHTYDEVRKDIQLWKAKANLVLAGHDYSKNWPEVMAAVQDELGPIKVCDTIWYKYLVPKISIVIPTLGRPEGLQRCLDSIAKLIYPKEMIETIVVEDIPRIGVPKRLKQGLEQVTGEFIVYGSNDIEFTPDSLIEAYKAYVQTRKGLIAFNTGPLLPDNGNICEHFMIKKTLISEIGGEIFDTEFNHVGVDNLLWKKCEQLDQNTRAEKAIIKHYHFSQGEKMDEVYDLGWAKVEEDRKILTDKLAKL